MKKLSEQLDEEAREISNKIRLIKEIAKKHRFIKALQKYKDANLAMMFSKW